MLSDFLQAYSHDLFVDSFKRILTHSVNNAKSNNISVRASSVSLFRSLISINTKSVDCDSNLSLAVTELLALPKTGKTSGPDHRAALYSMLALLPPSSVVSESIVQTATPLLAKETHEVAVSFLASALPSHVSFLLKNNKSLSTEVTGIVLKEMGSLKPPIKRAFCLLAGSAIWGSELKDSDVSEAVRVFAKGIIPALENALKNVSGNPLNASGGVLEAYIAVALLLGPLSKYGEFNHVISKNPVLQAISTVSVKPSFLLWDKVYQKATDPEDEKWLLRATDAALLFFKAEATKNESLR